jgi:hypothetical protein
MEDPTMTLRQLFTRPTAPPKRQLAATAWHRQQLPGLCLALLLGLQLVCASAEAVADPSILFSRGQSNEQAPYMAPHRLFSIRLPSNWSPHTFADRPELVEFRLIDSPITALLQIKRTSVMEGARAKQLMLRAVELRLKKLPHFNETSRRDVNIGGVQGAAVTGVFWYQGNAQYPSAIEEIFLVLGTDAYELHFECFAPLSGQMAGELNRLYQSFVPRPTLPSGMPQAPEDEEDPLDNIPF